MPENISSSRKGKENRNIRKDYTDTFPILFILSYKKRISILLQKKVGETNGEKEKFSRIIAEYKKKERKKKVSNEKLNRSKIRKLHLRSSLFIVLRSENFVCGEFDVVINNFLMNFCSVCGSCLLFFLARA